MSEKRIPKLNPRIQELSKEMLLSAAQSRRARLEVLKRQLATGRYQLSSAVVARSLVNE